MMYPCPQRAGKAIRATSTSIHIYPHPPLELLAETEDEEATDYEDLSIAIMPGTLRDYTLAGLLGRHSFSLNVFHARPFSRGQALLRSADPREPMRLRFNFLEDPRDAGEAFRHLEEIGYDGAFSFEAKHDPFLPLVLASQSTTRLTLGTAITIAFARNPMNLANLAWGVQAISGGRFLLGLGSQVRPHIENRFSMPWSRPAARMREMVLAIRAIFDAWEGRAELRFASKWAQPISRNRRIVRRGVLRCAWRPPLFQQRRRRVNRRRRASLGRSARRCWQETTRRHLILRWCSQPRRRRRF